MRTKNARACEKGTDLTATTLIEKTGERGAAGSVAGAAFSSWR